MSVEVKAKVMIAEQLGVDISKVVPGASFVDDLGADSLDIVELIMQFEEGFSISMPDEDAEKILKVEDAYKYINEKIGK